MPNKCPSIQDATDATLVSEDTDAIDVIKLHADKGHYPSKCLLYVINDLCQLHLKYPDYHNLIEKRLEDSFYDILADLYNAGFTEEEINKVV